MSRLTAADVMSTDLITVEPDMLLEECAELFSLKRITGAPVTDDEGILLGVISMRDIAAAAGHSGCCWPDFFRDLLVERRGSRDVDLRLTVQDLMNETVLSVPPGADLVEVVDTMLNLRIHRVIVVDSRRRVLGIVTTFDLVRLLPRLLGAPALAGTG